MEAEHAPEHDPESAEADLRGGIAETRWDCFSNILNIGEKKICLMKKKRTEWISETTWKYIDERRNLKTNLLSSCSEETKQVYRIAYEQGS